MSQSSLCKDQHYVAQLQSRHFCNAEGKLFQLRKSGWRVDTKPFVPKSALWGEEYYGPPGNAFDRIYTLIENVLGRHYDELCDAEIISDEAMQAFVSFFAAQVGRTPYADRMLRNTPMFQASNLPEWVTCGAGRLEYWSRFQGILNSPWLTWRRVRSTARSGPFVITDNPACVLPLVDTSAALWAFPLSSEVMMLGSDIRTFDAMTTNDIDHLNLMLVGAAVDRVYSGSQELLKHILADLAIVESENATPFKRMLRAPAFGNSFNPMMSRNAIAGNTDDSLRSLFVPNGV